MVVLNMVIMQCPARCHLGFAKRHLPKPLLFLVGESMNGPAWWLPQLPVSALKPSPVVVLAENLLQDTQFAID
jgi:hypothetical protein